MVTTAIYRALFALLLLLIAAPVVAQHQHQHEQQPTHADQGQSSSQSGAQRPSAADAAPGPAAADWQVAQPGGSLPGDPEISLEKVADGFADPVAVVSAPGDRERLFVVERPGRVRILRGGKLQEEPFLDIRDDVLSQFLEQGLYDIAFDPKFPENGYVYAHFAELLRNGDSVIVRYTVSKDQPDRIDPNSAKLILHIEQPYANHNGGELEFGPDGYLYIGVGDGGWEGDPLEAGQNLNTLLGKLLRIDVHAGDPSRAYGIPKDNPFADPAGLVRLFGISEAEFARIHPRARPEIWAYGLRNPWKFSFDPKGGDLYLPDVGQNQWEEINVEPAGGRGGVNYGWDFLMGTHCFPVQEKSCARVGVPPAAEYSHDYGCAVIGVGVYRGSEVPALDGVYLAGDFCSGRIWGLARDGDQWRFATLHEGQIRVTGGGHGPDGQLYVTSCACGYGGHQHQHGGTGQTGTVWRLVSGSNVQGERENK